MTFIHHARRSAADTPVRQPGLQRLPLLSTVAALLLAGVDAHAQTGVPNAGTILQQVQPALPAPPSAPAPSLRVQAVNPGATAATLSFAVKTVRITGNTVFSADVLHALVADGEGRTLTLAQVEALAARITAHYQASGYPLSRAVVPAQTVADGTVTIEVLEARYGKVGLNNSSRVDDAVLGATVAALQSGQAIDGSQLDRTLLLLSDIPGVGVNAVLKPGAEVGTSAIEIDATNTAFVLGSVLLDNYGNHYTGRARAGGSLDVLNPFHHGDTFSVSAVSSGDRMKYGRVAYDILLDGAGTRVGTSYSSVHYRLGRDIAALDAHGAADVASAWIKRPLIRDKQLNVYAQLQYDAKRLRDRVGVTDTRTDRQLDNWILTFNGDRRDDVLGGGISVWSLAWTRGHNGFDDAAAEAADALSARTRGSFSKWNANVSRLQGLSPVDSLALSAAAQWTDGNLDSAEKMSVGGPYTVRAYDVGAVSSDSGYFASAELRHDFGASAAGRWQAMAFVEAAHVKLNHRAWDAADNSATLSGVGLGLAWDGGAGWRANLSLAAPVGGRPSMATPPTSARAWLTASKAF